MKNKIVIFFFILSISSFSQNFNGEAIFAEKYKTNTKPENETSGFVIELLGKTLNKKYKLIFNQKESVFREEIALEKPRELDFLSTSAPDVLYINYKNKKYKEQKEFFGKSFLITDSLKTINWELTNKKKKIGKYNCFNAKAKINIEDTTISVDAWYTNEIPTQSGPKKFFGLPGLILEVETDISIIYCEQVSLNSKEEINIPKKGKLISSEEFDKLTKKKMEEYDRRNE